MAVTKRTRFEVLRRDGHACQYCGAKAPDVALQIDHVIPVALGGDDKPGNLVTACRDCNSGKSSIPPDSPLVQSLSGEAAAYALGMVDKMTRLRADVERGDELIESFEDEWGAWRRLDGTEEGKKVPLPPDYEMSLFRWSQMGVPFRVISLAIPKAMQKRGLRGEFPEFQYLAGIVWNMINAREIDYSVTDETAAVYTESEADEKSVEAWRLGYESGIARGRESAVIEQLEMDFLQHHIDQTEMIALPSSFDPDQPILTGGIRRRG